MATYIKLGRQRAKDSRYDPYARLIHPLNRMLKDAETIANWFNANYRKWDFIMYQCMVKEIRDIQYGPALYWKKVLQTELSPMTFKAAESWALRHKAGDFVDMALANQARDTVFKVLDTKLKLRHANDPYRALLDVLRFAFFGLLDDDPNNAFEL